MVDQNEPSGGPDPTDPNEGLNSMVASDVHVDNELMNTILFWAIVVAVVLMTARYSDTIRDWLKRLVS